MSADRPLRVVNELNPSSPGLADGRAQPVSVKVVGDSVIRRPIGYRRRVAEVASDYWIHERRRQAYKLLAGQFDTEQIGLFLHADPDVCTNPKVNAAQGDGTGTTGGYGWQNYAQGEPPLLGRRLRRAVKRDLDNALADSARYEARNREEATQIELAGLAAAQQGIWPRVLNGNAKAVEQYLGIVDKRMRLLGLGETNVNVSAQVTIDAVGVHPELTPEYQAQWLDALIELGAVKRAPELDPPAGDDIVDAEVVDDSDDAQSA